MPIPVSNTETVFSIGSYSTLISNYYYSPSEAGLETDINLIFSNASKEFDINSRKKISL